MLSIEQHGQWQPWRGSHRRQKRSATGTQKRKNRAGFARCVLFYFFFATGRDNQFVIKVILMQILYVAARSCSCSQPKWAWHPTKAVNKHTQQGVAKSVQRTRFCPATLFI